jgi:hypothetical protein
MTYRYIEIVLPVFKKDIQGNQTMENAGYPAVLCQGADEWNTWQVECVLFILIKMNFFSQLKSYGPFECDADGKDGGSCRKCR